MKKRFSQKQVHRTRKSAGRTNPEPDSLMSMLLAACRAAMIAFAVGILLLFGATAAAFSQEDPMAFAMPLGYAAAGLTACFAGFLASRFVGKRVLLSGLFSAGCLLFLFTLLSFLPQLAEREPLSPGISLALHAAVVPLALLGAYLGRRRPSVRRRR